MNESEIKSLWQKGHANQTITIDRKDMSKYESQYNKILNRISLLHDRGFQIALFVFCSFSIFIPPWAKSSSVIVYALSILFIFGLWYIFFLYERIRALIKTGSIGSSALVYFRRKRDIMFKVAFLQKVSMVYYMLLILFLFRARFSDIGTDYRYIVMLFFIVFMGIGTAIHYRRNISPTVIYLENLVKHLEEDES